MQTFKPFQTALFLTPLTSSERDNSQLMSLFQLAEHTKQKEQGTAHISKPFKTQNQVVCMLVSWQVLSR